MKSPMHTDLGELSWWQWILISILLIGQAVIIFRDAQKRGAKAWLWGLYGLMSCPTAYLVYWFCVIRKRNPKAKKETV